MAENIIADCLFQVKFWKREDKTIWDFFSGLDIFYKKQYKRGNVVHYHFLAYGVNKDDVEKLIETFHELFDVDFVNVRTSFFTLTSEYEYLDENRNYGDYGWE